MEISYIILAHKNPEQLCRLVNCLKGERTHIYLHIDRQVSMEPFKKVIGEQKNVYFLTDSQRQPGTWGDIGIVKGTLNAIEQIIQDKRSGYCILLTGQDYPLRSQNSLSSFLNKNNGTHFLDIFKMPGMSKELATDRLNRYKINKSSRRGHFTLLSSIFDLDFYQKKTLGQINFLRKSGNLKELPKIFQKRNFPSYLEAYGGSAYWTLPMETIKEIKEFVDENPGYLAYHNYTLCVDEIFFQSIIMHLKQKRNFEIRPSLTYINWEPRNGPKPATFKASDFEELKEASKEKFFARKFELGKDGDILAKIDADLLN